MDRGTRAALRAGALGTAPMLVGVVPFGLVAGATPVTEGLGDWSAIGFSTIVFAGASQLAAIDVLADGGSWAVAVVAACTINLRMLLYSASLAPFVAHVPMRQRLGVAYLLTDQAYAVSITRWQSEPVDDESLRLRLPYYLGSALILWTSWQLATITGVLIGNALPDDLPLEFAVPLVFLVLLVPILVTRPAVVAAVTAGAVAVATAELGAGRLYIVAGALAGIAAGALAEWSGEARGARA